MPANLPARHHYIPVFYLKQWMTSDRRICEYQRHHEGVVKPRRTHPSGTGYVRGLYDLVGIDNPENREAFEREFLKPVDTRAAELPQDIDAGRRAMNNPEKRSAWTRFLLSLLLRMPEDIKLHKERYLAAWMHPDAARTKYYKRIWRPGMPDKLEDLLGLMDVQEIEHHAMDALIPLMTNLRIGQYLINMKWGSMTLPLGAPALLTSDHPLIKSNGLVNFDSHIIMPIGPKTVFYAVNNQMILDYLMMLTPTELSMIINRSVVSQSVKYVYWQWDVNLGFVQKYMGSGRVPSLLEQMQENRSRRRPGRMVRKNSQKSSWKG